MSRFPALTGADSLSNQIFVVCPYQPPSSSQTPEASDSPSLSPVTPAANFSDTKLPSQSPSHSVSSMFFHVIY